MHLFASFILKIVFTLLKDFLFVEGVGLRSNIRHKNGEKYFFVDKDSNNWTCKFVISLWEFFIIANYSWILMEGLYLYNLIFSALFADSSRNIIHYIVLGWGLPVLVIIPWIITRLIFDDTLCWTTHKEKMIFLIIRIPIMISILINFFLFIRITIVIYSKLQAPIYEEARRYQKWAKSTLVLVPLFGIHYALLMGMSYFINQNSVIEAIWLLCDQFFASFQGFFVALLYCFLNAEVRTELKPHVHSFLTAWAMNDIFKYIFPCRDKYLKYAFLKLGLDEDDHRYVQRCHAVPFLTMELTPTETAKFDWTRRETNYQSHQVKIIQKFGFKSACVRYLSHRFTHNIIKCLKYSHALFFFLFMPLIF
ncbi:pdf receptor-like protein-related [Holotrichia oblita]|uniref:Pdf receptor-like protein-related n=1 Tax=Holotrichia oblita TaxID=644536 RepID=A0ACB9TT53_HOLOL|nr:pdf receptor-like protein-related [Holotrichia oblita]